MSQTPFWDRVFKTTSWVIVFFLFYSSISTFFVPPSPDGPVAQALGGVRESILFYMTLYATLGILLAYSKIRKRNTMRKWVLAGVYTTGIFTSILTYQLFDGFTPRITDNIILTVTSAGCWLYWVFKTEYISNEEFLAGYEDEH